VAPDAPDEPTDDSGKRHRRVIDAALIRNIDAYSRHAAEQAAKARKLIEQAPPAHITPIVSPISPEMQRAQRERRALQDAADRAAVDHMPAMARAIVQMAERGETESNKTTWILRIAAATLAVAVIGTLVAALH